MEKVSIMKEIPLIECTYLSIWHPWVIMIDGDRIYRRLIGPLRISIFFSLLGARRTVKKYCKQEGRTIQWTSQTEGLISLKAA